MKAMAVVRGQVVPLEQATVSVLDLGLTRGAAVFETMRTYGGRIYALSEHFERLQSGLDLLGLRGAVTERTLRTDFDAAFAASGGTEARMNVMVTPGVQTQGLYGAADPTVILTVRPLVTPAAKLYEDGVAVRTFAAQRELTSYKTTNYLLGKRGYEQAQAAGAHEALYVQEGLVTEGVTSNVVIRRGERLITPGENCLPGITLMGIEEAATQEGLSWSRGALSVRDLQEADEVWLTSSIRELLPVVKVDEASVGQGRPGSYYGRVLSTFRRNCWQKAAEDAASAG